MFLITRLSFLPPNLHPLQIPSLACLPEILHSFSSVTDLNSDGPIKALLHSAETPLGIVVHCSDFIKRAEPIFCLRFYSFIFRENGREGEEQSSVASCKPLTWDLAPNPGKCPDRELNWQPFGLHTGAQATEPHQPGQPCILFYL